MTSTHKCDSNIPKFLMWKKDRIKKCDDIQTVEHAVDEYPKQSWAGFTVLAKQDSKDC